MWFERLTTVLLQNIDNFENFKVWDRGEKLEKGP